MRKAVTHLQTEFAAVRTGRASSALVEKLKVDYYGSERPAPAARRLQRARAAGAHDLALRQGHDQGDREGDPAERPRASTRRTTAQVIRLTFPELTEERRKDLVKVVRNRAEEGRVAVRNVRRQARHELEALEKDGEIGKDDLDRTEKDLEKRTHEVIAEIDELLKHKEQELLAV